MQYNSKKGGGATIEGLAMSLQAAANGMDADNDILFLILTSHGSRTGLAVKAGRLTQTLTPSNLAYMLARTGMRYKVVVISACYSGDTLVITAADSDHLVRLPGQSQMDLFRQRVFQYSIPASQEPEGRLCCCAFARQKARSARALRAVESPNGRRRNVQPLLISRP
ncbi:C13 family peptidase [Bradyrhizobium sp. CSA112]|uniref:C13 family peptidase n=1 Tax=Bradyrhizobium sp. CSA112 TaxID=2699170 RepID=UPI0023AF237D|nr:C13 family peptidase [Bradyrhizobium sp. CSA112]